MPFDITLLDALFYSITLATLTLAIIGLSIARKARHQTRSINEKLLHLQQKFQRLHEEIARTPPDKVKQSIEKQLNDPAWIGRLYDCLENERTTREKTRETTLTAATAPTHPSSPPPSPEEPAFTRERVHALYERWCKTGEKPSKDIGIEVVPLRFASAKSASEFQKPIPLFEDAAQVAEFVRFSIPGNDEALVYPHPDASFSPTVKYLFPHLQETAYYGQTRDQFTHIEPVRLKRRDDRFWQQCLEA